MSAGDAGGLVGLVVCLAGSKRILKAMDAAVKDQNGGQVPMNLVLIDAEEGLFSPDFSWADILQRQV